MEQGGFYSASSPHRSAFVPHLLLRLAIAFSFLYPPVAAFITPDSWIGYFPPFMQGILPDTILLHGFGLIEIIIGLWILSGKNIFIPSLIASVMLIAITAFNLGAFDVVFRDISLALAALALALMNKTTRNQPLETSH